MRRCCAVAGVLATLCGVLLSGDVQAARSKEAAPPAAEVAEKRSDLKGLREQIEAMRKDVAAAEGTRADAADQLKDAEREISLLQRELHDLATQRGELQATLARLATQSRDMEARISGQQGQLEQLIRRQYLQGEPDLLRLLLNGDDPNQIARDLHYLTAIGRARGELLEEIGRALEQKKALAADTRERAAELTAVEERQKERREALVQRREQRKVALEKISARISAQRKEIGTKERDERRLSQLVERLAKIIAARPAPKRESAPAESKPQRPGREDKARGSERREATRTPEIVNEHTPDARAGGSFARLKGELRLPVKGVVSGRFGASRPEGGTWKGLFIRAAAGTEVRSIAAGRVVFADWMRGFGNLLIVDHSDGFLSIYGNNDALLKQVGDNVRGGDAIAAVGDSGGNPESGLYFELRQQGQALDPMKWVSVR
ncbi:peptidoglycan DD-metalloendopeptidase family protein [Rhodocyclus tenuis]|uniref:peptidoglycan DD-metalloendopeptidase family protein n=1 Tax=Rhodocyclus tenuis TaxID=1066 RepID=UPI00190331F3